MSRVIALVLLLLVAGATRAATVCRLVSGGGISFGSYDVFSSTPNDSLLNITLTCARDGGPQHVTAVMRLSPGVNGTSVTGRRMLHTGGSGDYLAYGLFRDVARSSNWGMTDGIDTVARSLSVPNKESASVIFTIYGRIPALQNVFAGNYSDSVQITVNY